MSKKMFSTGRWKRAQAARQRKRVGRKKAHKKVQKISESLRLNKANTNPSYKKLIVPPVFSLLRNHSEVLEFINQVRFYGDKHKNIDLKFDDVIDVGIEAIAALVAMLEFYHQFSLVKGNLPNDSKCKAIIVQSGFLERTNVAGSLPLQSSGRIIKRKANRVAPEAARELIRHGTRVAFGAPKKCQAAQRALLEGMQNTFDHADRRNKGEEAWVAMSYADSSARRVSFVLVDSGVGIFKSVRINKIRSIFRAVGIEKNTDVLRDILARRIPSSTGLSYRGRGLPSFTDAAERGTLKNVTVISNDVLANVNDGTYRTMTDEFDGTLLYWEIEG